MGLKKTLEKMKNYKIERKLTVSFRTILTLMLISVLVCIGGLVYVSTSFSNFYNYYHTITSKSLDARMSVQGAVKSVAITLLTDDEASISRFQNDAATYIERLGTDLDILLNLYKGDTSPIEETVEALVSAKVYREKINGCVLAGKHEEALSVYMNEYGPTMTIVQNNMTSLDEQVASLAAEAYNTSNIVDKLVILAAVIISIISFLTTITLSKGLITMLKKPIEEIERAAVDMAAGSLHVQLDYTSEDEFGSLAESMRMFPISVLSLLISETFFPNFPMVISRFPPDVWSNISETIYLFYIPCAVCVTN